MRYMVSYQYFTGLSGSNCFSTLDEAEEFARLNWGTMQSIEILTFTPSDVLGFRGDVLTTVLKIK